MSDEAHAATRMGRSSYARAMAVACGAPAVAPLETAPPTLDAPAADMRGAGDLSEAVEVRR